MIKSCKKTKSCNSESSRTQVVSVIVLRPWSSSNQVVCQNLKSYNTKSSRGPFRLKSCSRYNTIDSTHSVQQRSGTSRLVSETLSRIICSGTQRLVPHQSSPRCQDASNQNTSTKTATRASNIPTTVRRLGQRTGDILGSRRQHGTIHDRRYIS